MTGYLVDVGVKIAQERVKIVTPCLGPKSSYKSGLNPSQTGQDLVSGMDITDVKNKLDTVVNSMQGVTEKFYENMEVLQEEILHLEEENVDLERRLAEIERDNDDKLKNSEEYKKYHDILYGDLDTNINRAINNVLRDSNMNNLGDSEDMFEI